MVRFIKISAGRHITIIICSLALIFSNFANLFHTCSHVGMAAHSSENVLFFYSPIHTEIPFLTHTAISNENGDKSISLNHEACAVCSFIFSFHAQKIFSFSLKTLPHLQASTGITTRAYSFPIPIFSIIPRSPPLPVFS
jgi:hypothetical protein